MTETCEACRFYGTSEKFGAKMFQACRRFPRVVQKDPKDWCGEWQVKG